MKANAVVRALDLGQLPPLLRGEAAVIGDWLREGAARRVLFQSAVIVVGAGLFGAAVGAWRGGLQAAYVAVKLPLILLSTAVCNGLANGMMAPLLGLNISFRQSLTLVLSNFTIAAVILAGFSPVMFFAIWNTAQTDVSGAGFYTVLLLGIAAIAFSGVAASARLLGLLRELAPDRSVARNVLFAWLAGNLFLGAQISWSLRPFIGSPEMAVEFLRADAFSGNFYEAVLRVVGRLLSGQ